MSALMSALGKADNNSRPFSRLHGLGRKPSYFRYELNTTYLDRDRPSRQFPPRSRGKIVTDRLLTAAIRRRISGWVQDCTPF